MYEQARGKGSLTTLSTFVDNLFYKEFCVSGVGGSHSLPTEHQGHLHLSACHQGCPWPCHPLCLPHDSTGPWAPGPWSQNVSSQSHIRFPQT